MNDIFIIKKIIIDIRNFNINFILITHHSIIFIVIKKLNIISFELLKNTKSFQSNLILFASFHLLIFRFSLIDRYMNYIVQRSSYFVYPR